MAVIENSKVAIIGAGAVGTAIAYASLIRGSAREVALYDVAAAKVDAEVLDLAHGTQFTGSSRITGGSDLSVIDGANMIVVTAGAKQNPGQTRLDLAATNIRILEDLMPKMIERAPDAVFMLVTNPCDVLAFAAQQITGLPASRVFSSGTVLDSSRLRWVLAERAGVNTSSVHAMIVGEHGDSEFALWSQARIGPVPILDWQRNGSPVFTIDELDAIQHGVTNAAYTIIAGKGATNYAIGLSATRIIEAVLRDEKAILPVSSVLTDYRGVSGVALSVPSVVDSSGVSAVIPVPFDAAEDARFLASADAVRASIATLGL